jgi:curved DNA-binding protein CbpA
MNINKATQILELNNNISEHEIKKKYKLLALKYHPDKNNSHDAKERFQDIKNAYEYIMKYEGYMDCDNEIFEEEKNENDYHTILQQFINLMTSENNQTSLVKNILQIIYNMCEDKALLFIKTIDKNKLILIYDFLTDYASAFHYSDHFLEKIKSIIYEKTKDDERIILKPSLDDLFEQNVYKLQYNDNYYYIPLWQPEMIYEISNNQLFVSCQPDLPKHIRIDDKNNIYIEYHTSLIELWKNTNHHINIGKQKWSIDRENLYMKNHQTICFHNKGIPKIISEDVYDVSKLSNVYINIHITNLQ